MILGVFKKTNPDGTRHVTLFGRMRDRAKGQSGMLEVHLDEARPAFGWTFEQWWNGPGAVELTKDRQVRLIPEKDASS